MTERHAGNLTPIRPHLDANTPQRAVFIHGLALDAHIGVYDHELGRSQPVIIDIEMAVMEPSNPVSDSLEDVVCYNRLTRSVQEILDEGHINLVETLAERIAAMCLSHPMGLSVRVRVNKPEAIETAIGAGVEIVRHKKI